MDENEALVCDKEMSEILNKYFASVFTTECQDYLPAIKNIFFGADCEKLCNFCITADMVKNEINKLKMNNSPDNSPDEASPGGLAQPLESIGQMVSKKRLILVV